MLPEIRSYLHDILEAANSIEDARRIVNLRNWVIHGYDKVDDGLIWGIVSKDLPILKMRVEELMRS